VQQDIYDGPELSGNRQEKAGLPQLQKQGSKKTNYVISHKDLEKKLSTMANWIFPDFRRHRLR
jgi:hypothetical protein